MNSEDFKKYLPSYLTPESKEELINDIKGFPGTVDARIYSSKFKEDEIVYQGDGIQNMLFINLPDTKTHKRNAIIISNSCDINKENVRFFESRVLYAPIFKLEKYEMILRNSKKKSDSAIRNHIINIRKQLNTQIFYLPQLNNEFAESIVFLDRILNVNVDEIETRNLKKIRLFSLSQFGHYLLVFKLSLHLSRIMENIDRNN
ncbi:MAG: hypothetical protein K9J25_13205 [Bacteroidales bacterium]|nr:hypothetical protein [Bacteroidales bacterium]